MMWIFWMFEDYQIKISCCCWWFFFSEAEKFNNDYDIHIDFKMKSIYFNRLIVSFENPNATSIEFMRLMKNILKNLVCIKPESGFGN